jgi:NQR2, RnfD, RnfE family
MQVPLVLFGLLVFGFRAAIVVVLLLLCCEFLERRRRAVRLGPPSMDGTDEARRVRVEAVLLALLLPASVASVSIQNSIPVLLIPCGAILLMAFRFLAFYAQRSSTWAVVLAALTLHLLFPAALTPRHVLLPHAWGVGDLLDSAPYEANEQVARPELMQLQWRDVSAVELSPVTVALKQVGGASSDEERLHRIAFELPQLESVFLGVQPNYIGAASGLVLLIVAAWGVGYARRIDFVALVSCLACAYLNASVLLWLFATETWPVTLTIVHYFLLSGLPMFAAIFLLARIEQLSMRSLRLTAVVAGLLMPVVGPLGAAAIVLGIAKKQA